MLPAHSMPIQWFSANVAVPGYWLDGMLATNAHCECLACAEGMRMARLLPSLDLLRGFEAAARQLSFTKAAAELFLTQSAVSRQVQTLEEQLGTSLFERHHRQIHLTPAGQKLYRATGD